MTPTKRRLALGGGLAAAALLFGLAYRSSLVPATHPDHDHGILNLDAGGRLLVQKRDGSERNLVGRPGKVLVVHFFAPTVPGAAEEISALFSTQSRMKADPGVEWVLIARSPDFAALDGWLAENKLVPPAPATLYVDPKGETTQKLNCKRPIDTMYFNAEGKLASQSRGMTDWVSVAPARIAEARGGATIE